MSKTVLTKKFRELCVTKLLLNSSPSLRVRSVDILQGSWLGKCLLCDAEVGQILYRGNNYGGRKNYEYKYDIGVATCCAGRICSDCEKELKPKRNLRLFRARR